MEREIAGASSSFLPLAATVRLRLYYVKNGQVNKVRVLLNKRNLKICKIWRFLVHKCMEGILVPSTSLQ